MLEAMLSPITAVVDAVCQVIERTPPELVSDIIKNGICMTGGGSLLKGFNELITEITGIRTRVASNPINCVVLGTGRAFEKIGTLTEAGVNISGGRRY
jgi:rod shape-determining protein MreB